jgi:hypothetical protein
VFSKTVSNCALSGERSKQRAANFQNKINVLLIYVYSKCVHLLKTALQAKFLYFLCYNWILCHSFCISFGRDIKKNTKCGLLSQHRPITKFTFVENFAIYSKKCLLIRLYVRDKIERVYVVGENDTSWDSPFCNRSDILF